MQQLSLVVVGDLVLGRSGFGARKQKSTKLRVCGAGVALARAEIDEEGVAEDEWRAGDLRRGRHWVGLRCGGFESSVDFGWGLPNFEGHQMAVEICYSPMNTTVDMLHHQDVEVVFCFGT